MVQFWLGGCRSGAWAADRRGWDTETVWNSSVIDDDAWILRRESLELAKAIAAIKSLFEHRPFAD